MAENPFVNANRHPKNNHQNNEEGINSKRTQTITHDPAAHSSTQPVSENAENLLKKGKKLKKRKKEKNNVTAGSTSSSATKQSKNPVKELFQACGRCCKRKNARIAKSKTSFVNYVKEKTKKCRTKKSRSKQPAAATAASQEGKDKQEEKIEHSKTAKRKDSKKKEPKKEDPLHVPLSSPPTLQAVENGKLKLNEILGIDVEDFTKSCCYLCAKNAMAIAAAISGQTGKSNATMQTSVRFKETSTMDKSSSPMTFVRTVQSSVKVRTRDMGTLHPEKKRNKKSRPKLNFKRLSIIPKVKFPGRPRVRTVACETDKSMGHNNIPQCRARRGTHCIMENK